MTDPNPGLAVDAGGNPVIDPTPNVLGLVDAANRRQDDLRQAEQDRVEQLAILRAKHAAEILDLRARLGEKGEQCQSELADIREKHAEQMRAKEAQRIDAIRQVDVEASQRDKEAVAVKADTLAKQVQDAAVVMRGQVDAAATAAAVSLRQALEPITRSIEDLRRTQAEDRGQKTQVVETQAKGQNTNLWIGLGIAAAVLVLMMIMAVVAIYVAVNNGGAK